MLGRFNLKRLRRLNSNQDGAASVEFILSFPILLIATLIVFDIGFGVQKFSTLNHAANDAARFASARAVDNLFPVTEAEITAFARTQLVGLIGDPPTITITVTPPASGPDETQEGHPDRPALAGTRMALGRGRLGLEASLGLARFRPG